MVAGDLAQSACGRAPVAGDPAMVASDLTQSACGRAPVAGALAMVADDFATVAGALAMVAGDSGIASIRHSPRPISLHGAYPRRG